MLSDTFHYTGEGQVGDMAFIRGNWAIRDHVTDGKNLHLFEKTSKDVVQYLGQMVCAGYEWVEGVRDVDGNPRRILMFYLQPIARLVQLAEAHAGGDVTRNGERLWSLPLVQLRSVALTTPVAGPTLGEAHRIVYRRSEAVRAYVLRRADGRCEECGALAPFATPQGRPYLEPQHIRRLSDGGPDHLDHVVALCPNCHRRVHLSADGNEFNAELGHRFAAGSPS